MKLLFQFLEIIDFLLSLFPMFFALLSILIKSILLLPKSLGKCFSGDLHLFELLLSCCVFLKRSSILYHVEHLQAFVCRFIVRNVIVFENAKLFLELVSHVFSLEDED